MLRGLSRTINNSNRGTVWIWLLCRLIMKCDGVRESWQCEFGSSRWTTRLAYDQRKPGCDYCWVLRLYSQACQSQPAAAGQQGHVISSRCDQNFRDNVFGLLVVSAATATHPLFGMHANYQTSSFRVNGHLIREPRTRATEISKKTNLRFALWNYVPTSRRRWDVGSRYCVPDMIWFFYSWKPKMYIQQWITSHFWQLARQVCVEDRHILLIMNKLLHFGCHMLTCQLSLCGL